MLVLQVDAQGTPEIQKRLASEDPVHRMVPRVIVLAPPPISSTPQNRAGVAQRVEKIMAERRRAQNRKRKPLLRLPTANSTPSTSKTAGQANGTQNGRPSEGRAGEIRQAQSKEKRKSVPADILPQEQYWGLAQELLVQMIGERLSERMAVLVVPTTEVAAQMQALHLTSKEIYGNDARHRENGRKLCVALHAQAIVMPRLDACVVEDGVTRSARLFAAVDLLTLPENQPANFDSSNTQSPNTQSPNINSPNTQSPNTNSTNTKPLNIATTPLLTAGRLRAHRPTVIGPSQWPAHVDLVGAAEAERMVLRSGYQKTHDGCIRDAAQQAAHILVHTLATGEQAPFMRVEDRMAVMPVFAPTRADRLLFTSSGRKLVPMAIGDLESDVSLLFTPNLLPLAPERIIQPDEVIRLLTEKGEESNGIALFNLWLDDSHLDLPRTQRLGRLLAADYLLVTRITDIELALGTYVPPELATSDSLRYTLEESRTRTDPEQNGRRRPAESSARVEAVANLVRVHDGRLLWQGRSTSRTVSSPLSDLRPMSDTLLIRDATRFALIDIQRQLRAYQAQFEN